MAGQQVDLLLLWLRSWLKRCDWKLNDLHLWLADQLRLAWSEALKIEVWLVDLGLLNELGLLNALDLDWLRLFDDLHLLLRQWRGNQLLLRLRLRSRDELWLR